MGHERGRWTVFLQPGKLVWSRGSWCKWWFIVGASYFCSKDPFPDSLLLSLRQTREPLLSGSSTSLQGFSPYLSPSSGKHWGQLTHISSWHTAPWLPALTWDPSHHQITFLSALGEGQKDAKKLRLGQGMASSVQKDKLVKEAVNSLG